MLCDGKLFILVRAPEHAETALEISEEPLAIRSGEIREQATIGCMTRRFDLLDDASAVRCHDKPAPAAIFFVPLLANETAVFQRIDDGTDRRLRQAALSSDLRSEQWFTTTSRAEVRVARDLQQNEPLQRRDACFGGEPFSTPLEMVREIEQDEDDALFEAGGDRRFRRGGARRHAARSFSQIAIACALVACASSTPIAQRREPPQLTTEQLVRLRCATDGREVMMAWQGRVEARVPNEPPRLLFRVFGMNVGRCVQKPNGWFLTSRELMYYLDPETGAVVHAWANPWTGKTVPVVHVANALVQNQLRGPLPIEIVDANAIVRLDIDVTYPNPLARDPQLQPFSPQPEYKASEHFAFATPASALDQEPTVPSVQLTWKRTGPWLPWMDMGDRAGELFYESEGRRTSGLDELPAFVRDDITTRLPLFAHAPACVTTGRNETSWTYFAAHIDEYLRGERFPVAAPVRTEPCAP